MLSTWTDPAVLALADEIGNHPIWGLPRLGKTKRDLLSILQEIRAAGYAVRASHYRSESPLANKLEAIGCPVYRDEVAVGALVMLWSKGLLTPKEFAELESQEAQGSRCLRYGRPEQHMISKAR